MKPRKRIAETTTPDGKPVVLVQHDGDFVITVDREDLMLSRAHESEFELARVGCAHCATKADPTVLIGGLGMGYTLRKVLDILQPGATVVVAELLPEMVRWNRDYLGELNNHAIDDKRVILEVRDVTEIIRQSPGRFDAVMLDVDNGPNAIVDPSNDYLYGDEGICTCLNSLKRDGRLAIWSAMDDPPFEQRLRHETPHVKCVYSPSYKGGKSSHCCIWVAWT